MAEQLRGKIALVTGASSGIGRATAQVFSREGAKVVIADTNVEGGEETTESRRGCGHHRAATPGTGAGREGLGD